MKESGINDAETGGHPGVFLSAYPHGSVLTRAFGHTLTNPRICDYPSEGEGRRGTWVIGEGAGVGGVDTSIPTLSSESWI